MNKKRTGAANEKMDGHQSSIISKTWIGHYMGRGWGIDRQ